MMSDRTGDLRGYHDVYIVVRRQMGSCLLVQYYNGSGLYKRPGNKAIVRACLSTMHILGTVVLS